MPGLMQEHALSLVHFFDRCEAMFPHKTVTTAYGMDKRTKVSYGEWADRTRRLGGLLDRIGVSKGARVGSFCWNTFVAWGSNPPPPQILKACLVSPLQLAASGAVVWRAVLWPRAAHTQPASLPGAA